MTKYISIPYEEYQSIIKRLDKFEQESEEAIFYKKLYDLGGEEFNEKEMSFLCECELSVRSYNVLRSTVERSLRGEKPIYSQVSGMLSNKFQFVGDLVQYRDPNFLTLSNFGRRSLNELKEWLKRKYNLTLGMDLPNHVNLHLNKLRKELYNINSN